MNSTVRRDRRGFLGLAAAGMTLPWLSMVAPTRAGATLPGPTPDSFPHQDPDTVREVVGASHGNFERVRELVDARPALARATWDWGFGDWETALGAASHTGNRDIARYLIERGARPTLFSAATLGQLAVVRAFCEASPGVQSIPGPHGITLLSHARAGGEEAAGVAAYLEALGGADEHPELSELSEQERRSLHGTYAYGGESSERLTVLDSSRAALQIRRGDGVPRALHHLGGLAFYPAGVPSARVEFRRDGGAITGLRVLDGPVELVAARLP